MTEPLEAPDRIAGRPLLHFCDECGEPFYKMRVDQVFHSPTCKSKRYGRRAAGGLALYDAAMKWRIGRDKGSLGDMTFIADNLAHEERKIAAVREKRITEFKKVKGLKQ